MSKKFNMEGAKVTYLFPFELKGFPLYAYEHDVVQEVHADLQNPMHESLQLDVQPKLQPIILGTLFLPEILLSYLLIFSSPHF